MNGSPYQPCLENVAVTGATGFLGSHLVSRLVSAGCRPTLFSRSERYGAFLAGLERQVDWALCDLTDSDSIHHALRSVKPKTLFHLAGTRGRAGSANSAILNFYGTGRLLELALRNRVQRIVIVGSAEEYGNYPGPLNEQVALRPCTEYGVSKALATRYALALHAQAGCPVVVVRPFSVYGPGQPGKMFVAQAVEAAVRGAPFTMSLGEQKRDLVFVKDVVAGLVIAAITPRIEGKVINLGTGRPNRLRDVAARIWEMTGSRAPLIVGELQPAPEELCDTWADTREARELLNWEAEVDLDEGLRQTISFASRQYRNGLQLCQTA